MTDIQAAVGIEQMKRLDWIVGRRRELAARYTQALAEHPWLRPPYVPEYAESNFQSYAVQLTEDAPISRDELMQRLLDEGISTRRGIMLAHIEPAYAGHAQAQPLQHSELRQRPVAIAAAVSADDVRGAGPGSRCSLRRMHPATEYCGSAEERELNRPAWQRRLILAGKIGLAGGLLAWLLVSGRLQLGRLASVSLDWRFAVLLALVAGSMIVPAFRWWWLLRIQGLREPAWKIVSLTWAGYLAAMVLPGAAGGDWRGATLFCDGAARRVPEPSRRSWRIASWDSTAYSALGHCRRYGCWLTAGRDRPFRRWRPSF